MTTQNSPEVKSCGYIFRAPHLLIRLSKEPSLNDLSPKVEGFHPASGHKKATINMYYWRQIFAMLVRFCHHGKKKIFLWVTFFSILH
jgi:hypothetical protein